MAIDIGELQATLGVDTRGVDRADRRMREFQNSTETRFQRISRRAAAFGRNYGRGIAAGVVAAGAAFAYVTNKALDTADAIDKGAKTAGLGIEQFQELTFVLEQNGVRADDASAAFRRFNRRLGLARDDTGAAADTFGELNIALQTNEGQLRSTGAVMDDALARLASIENEANRAAKASELFGEDSGPRLAAALNDGIQGIEELRARARELGIVWERDLVQNAVEAKDRLNEMSRVVRANVYQAFAELAPEIEDVSQQLAENPEMIRDAAEALAALGNVAIQTGRGFLWLSSNVHAGLQAIGVIDTSEFSDITREMEKLVAVRDRFISKLEDAPEEGSFGDVFFANRKELLADINAINEKILELQKRREALIDTPGPDRVTVPDFGGGGGGGDGEGDGIDRSIEAMKKRAREFDAVWEETVTDFARLNEEAAARSAAAFNELEQEWNSNRRAFQRLNEQAAQESIRAYEELDREWNQAQRQFQALEDQHRESTDAMQDQIQQWSHTFSGALADMLVEGEFTFDQLLKSFTKMMVQMAIQQAAVAPAFGFLTGGGASAGGAKGLAYEGGVQKMAQGGLVTGPTMFGTGNGVAVGGEMGDEALFPITRNARGDLSVHGAAPEVNLSVRVVNNTGEQADVSTQTRNRGDGVQELIIQLDRAMADRVNRGQSEIGRAVEGRYGLSPKGINRG
jgi:hypothetical protein